MGKLRTEKRKQGGQGNKDKNPQPIKKGQFKKNKGGKNDLKKKFDGKKFDKNEMKNKFGQKLDVMKFKNKDQQNPKNKDQQNPKNKDQQNPKNKDQQNSKNKVKMETKNVKEEKKGNPSPMKKKEMKTAGKIKKKKKDAEVEEEDAEVEEEDDEKLTLDIIKELGGDNEDLQFLEKETDKSMSRELDQTGEKELKDLISSLQLNKYTIDSFIVQDVENDTEEEKNEENKTKKDKEKKEKAPSKDPKGKDGQKKEEIKNKKSSGGVQENKISSTTTDDSDEEVKRKPEFHFLKTTSNRSYCVVKSNEKWYTNTSSSSGEEGARASPGEGASSSSKLSYWLPKIEKYTERIWEAEVANYEAVQKGGASKGEKVWLQQVLKSGTLTDKMSAYVVQIHDSPVHTFTVLETLLALVSLKSRRPCLLALDTLTNLLVEDLLIPHRKLRAFDKNPFHLLQELTGGNKDTRDRFLIAWMYEDRLRDFVLRFIQAMDIVGKDTIENTRVKVISCTQRLLSGTPEQEQLLLERLINRLGDPTRAVAAKAMHHLSMVLEEHPGMKDILVKEVERLLYRPNINPKAQYYGICFLSQLMLDRRRGGSDLAGKLVKIYFSFFQLSIKKGEIDTKLMSALLTGVNRAFPYSSLEPQQLDQQLETMHKLVHMVSFNISVQTLTLLFQIMDSRDSVTDRYYTALYRKALDPAFAASTKQVMFLNLLYNSVRKDASAVRVRAFLKRLLQSCEYLPSHTTAGVLYILSEILRNRTDLGSLRSVLESQDGNTDFSRFDDSDGEEHYEDVKEDEDEKKEEENNGGKHEDIKEEKETPGWTFNTTSSLHKLKTSYDPLCRNPLYSGAERSAYWELEDLCQHFHPTVALFARNLSENVPIKHQGDPLSDFTIPKFLDRFVFRNPKKDPAKNKPATVLGKRNIYRPSGIKAVAPDSKEFVRRQEESIPGDELFLYRYFQAKSERKGEAEEDNASVTSEDFNDFLDKMGGRAKEFEDEDVDFANGLQEGSDEEQGDEEQEEEEEDDDDEDNDEGSEPEGLDGESADGFKDLSDDEKDEDTEANMKYLDDDDEEEDFDFSDQEEEEQDAPPIKKKKMSILPAKKKFKKDKFGGFDPNNLEGLLADAEEFSHLLEQNLDEGTSMSVSTKDKAGAKQLKWEQNREKFMQGKQWNRGGKGKDRGGKGEGSKGNAGKGKDRGGREKGGKGNAGKSFKGKPFHRKLKK